MKDIKNGFTLAEVLTTIAVIGIVASISLPMLKNSTPNKDKVMLKKAYMIVSRATTELMRDESLYPDFEESGFGGNATDTPAFCNNFTNKINTVGNTTSCSFYTTDGIHWNLSGIDWSAGNDDGIIVDVNGTTTGSNCLDGTNNCSKPDRFRILLKKDGHIVVKGNKAKEYLESTGLQ